MKVYVIQNTGVEHNELLGFYTDKKLAERDMEFIAKNDVLNGRTFQQRWVKCGRCWYEQSRSRTGREKFPEWESPREAKKSGWILGTMHIVEYAIREHDLQGIADAVKIWQKRGDVHQLTCGNDSNHPPLVPYYAQHPIKGVGLECKHKNCDWRQLPDHPILALVHASFIRNRA